MLFELCFWYGQLSPAAPDSTAPLEHCGHATYSVRPGKGRGQAKWSKLGGSTRLADSGLPDALLAAAAQWEAEQPLHSQG